MSEFGDLLKQLRGNKSLRSVAEETELSHTYISDLEKGYRRGSHTPLHPSVDTIRRLSQAYNYPYKELMKAAGYWSEEEEEKQAFEEKHNLRALAGESRSYRYQGIDELDEEQREELQDYIELLRRQKQRREERRKKE